MMQSGEQFKKILEFRKRKSEELQRPISFSEAMALWLSESLNVNPKRSRKKVFIQ